MSEKCSAVDSQEFTGDGRSSTTEFLAGPSQWDAVPIRWFHGTSALARVRFAAHGPHATATYGRWSTLAVSGYYFS